MDIEKAVDSLIHNFLIKVLEKVGFKTNFVNWIKNQEPCIINGGSTN